MHYFLSLFLLLMNFAVCDENAVSGDLECPTQFHVQQHPVTRMFRVFEDEQFLGAVVNSSYGVMDFYDDKKEKQWVNRFDELYDCLGNCVGKVKLASDTEKQEIWEKSLYPSTWIELFFYYTPSTLIEIFSAQDELLATVEAESGKEGFVFRDVDKKPLAVAFWKWVPKGTRGWLWQGTYCVQDWEVIIVDHERLREKKIPNVFLIWALLKHSQKYFPKPACVPYQSELSFAH